MYETQQYSPRKFNFLPPVCKNLLIINTLCYLFSVVLQYRGFDINDIFGLHFFMAKHHYLYQYITYAFMHANFSHLFFNMFAVWMFGYLLENVWGAKKFLFYCFVTIVGAALIQQITYLVMYRDLVFGSYSHIDTGLIQMPVETFLNNIKTVGASGMVFGLLLAFGMMFPNMPIYLYFLFPIKAKWFVTGYVLIELFNGVVGSSDGVAHFAHLGGALFGFLLLTFWKMRRQ